MYIIHISSVMVASCAPPPLPRKEKGTHFSVKAATEYDTVSSAANRANITENQKYTPREVTGIS